MSSVTSSQACSKCSGVGRIWASSPGKWSFGQIRWAVLTAASLDSAKQTFALAWTGLLSPPCRKRSMASASGLVVAKPSPIRAARSTAFGPNPVLVQCLSAADTQREASVQSTCEVAAAWAITAG
jgi:hypothetical protein